MFEVANISLYFSSNLLVQSVKTPELKDRNNSVDVNAKIKQEFARPRWPYDMRPSARAEKYMCVIVIR